MPSHIKTYDESEYPEDHLKIFQADAKTERWVMPTWCYMFNSTLTENARVWFDDLPTESIDSYDDLKKAFLENYLQQKKCIKDPIEIHNIKQRDGESTEDFMRRYKLESIDVKGAPECMRISRFGEVVASNHKRKKSFPPWKQQGGNQKQNFEKRGFWNQQRPERKQDWFTLLKKTSKEIFALEKGKFKALAPMTPPVEKQNHAKFYEFHGKLSHLIKELKQNNEKEQPKEAKKRETSRKDKALAILMVQPWERVARQRITQSFPPNPKILFPPLGEDEVTEGLMIIEAEIGAHCIHRMYVDGGSASEILYEHFFSRICLEIKNQLVPTTTPLIGFSGEIIWLIGQIQLLVKIGDKEHSTLVWMSFVVVRSPSPYNGIIGRPGVRKLQVVPSITHGMLKLLVEGGVITLKSSGMVPLECAMVYEPEGNHLATKQTVEERIKVAINPEYLEQTIMIGSTLTEEGHNKLYDLLQHNLGNFSWKPADMTGVPRHIAEHCLNEEVGKLVEAGIMKEVHYHDWLSNPVMVGRNLEVYVDDLVIKSCTKDEIVRDIEETFKTLREINMKLNPKKCTFGGRRRDFLRIQSQLQGAESMSRQGRRCLKSSIPKMLKRRTKVKQKARKPEQTAEAEEAFKQMKQLIAELPMLATPMEKEELIVYLAAAKEMPIQQVLSRLEVTWRLQK
ncbi:reverse transcriptase domain-containing protein [Tanacetum coccineum]